MLNISKYYLFLIVIVILSFSCKENEKSQDAEIKSALIKLQNKNYSEAWLVITAGFGGSFIQFYSYNNDVYFDFPIYSEIKNKYKNESFEGKIDSICNDTFITKDLSDKQVLELKKLLNDFKLDFKEVRLGFINPTYLNQTDTTGWVTTLQGVFTIDYSQAKQFIDEYFSKVYEIKTDSVIYTIEEN